MIENYLLISSNLINLVDQLACLCSINTWFHVPTFTFFCFIAHFPNQGSYALMSKSTGIAFINRHFVHHQISVAPRSHFSMLGSHDTTKQGHLSFGYGFICLELGRMHSGQFDTTWKAFYILEIVKILGL